MHFLFLFCFSLWAGETVPVVDASFFTKGKSWTWDYFAEGDRLHSVERYTVIEARGGQVLLEMSTHFPGQGTFNAHHRLLVPVDRCLAAYRNPVQKRPWSFRMFFKSESGWRETKPPTTLAFEEKFNCNPHRHDSREFLTEFKEGPEGRMFQHRRWRRLEGSWFFMEGAQRAVAAEKAFKHSAAGKTYRMRLRP